MAGEPELTGLAKTFNSQTFTGRANVAKVSDRNFLGYIWTPFQLQATYGAILLTVLAVKAKNYAKAK